MSSDDSKTPTSSNLSGNKRTTTDTPKTTPQVTKKPSIKFGAIGGSIQPPPESINNVAPQPITNANPAPTTKEKRDTTTKEKPDTTRDRAPSVSSIISLDEEGSSPASKWPTFDDWYNMPLEGRFFPPSSNNGTKNNVVIKFLPTFQRDNNGTPHLRSGLWTAWDPKYANKPANKKNSYTDAAAVWVTYDKSLAAAQKQVPSDLDIAAILITCEPHNENTDDKRMHLTVELFVDEQNPPKGINMTWVGTLHLYINRFRDINKLKKTMAYPAYYLS